MDHVSPFKIIVLGITIFIAIFSILIFSGRVPFFDNKSSNGPQYSGKVSIWGTISKSKMDKYLSSFTASKVVIVWNIQDYQPAPSGHHWPKLYHLVVVQI